MFSVFLFCLVVVCGNVMSEEPSELFGVGEFWRAVAMGNEKENDECREEL